ncbi:MAG: hypothetical protein KGY99_10490 [Phycisphaerae bacterium]|nr:hypothetical protein [Phycisphaerae bacterium]
MTAPRPLRAALIAAVLLAVPTGRAEAFIAAVYSLKQVMNESTHILVGEIAQVDPKGRTAVMVARGALKGDLERRRVNMNIALGPGHHAAYVMPRLSVGAPAIVFYRRKGKQIASVAHAGVRQLSPAYGAGFADLDNDGDLDLAVNLATKVVVAYNNMPRAPKRRAVSIRVQSSGGRIGAVVRALGPGGRVLGLRELNGAEGCGGQACPVAHCAVPLGTCRITVALSDGRAAARYVTVRADETPLELRFGETEFR